MTRPAPDSPGFLDSPALAPPPGVTPNFENPESLRQPELAVVQLILVTLVVCMRLFTKKVVVKKMLAEDWWLLAAWICFIGFQVIVFKMENLPLGVHQWDITIRSTMRQAKLFLIATAIYAVVALPLKLAIILQIRRIVLLPFQSSRVYLRLIIDAFIFLNISFYLIFFLFQFFTCIPLRAAWDPRVSGTCVPHHLVFHIASGSINTVSDLITIVLPQPVIWRLKISRRKKWGLSAVFALGGLACIASIFRLYYAVKLTRTQDLTFVVGQMGKWIEPELTFGFLAVGVPVLPAFVKYVGCKVRGVECQPSGPGPSTKGSSTWNPGLERGRYASGGGSDANGKGGFAKMEEEDIEFGDWTGGREDSVASLRGSSEGTGIRKPEPTCLLR